MLKTVCKCGSTKVKPFLMNSEVDDVEIFSKIAICSKCHRIRFVAIDSNHEHKYIALPELSKDIRYRVSNRRVSYNDIREQA